MKVFLLVNPSAGGGRAKAVAREAVGLLKQKGVDMESAESESAQDLTELARMAAQTDSDRVLVVGGDGTWHFALNGLARTGMPAALIPCGRGNDFCRNINLPLDVSQAVTAALEGPVKDLDLVWTGTRHYIGVGGVGFDSEVTECANTQIPLFTGALAYSAAVFYKLFAFKSK
ncbi:MAG: acylglycerol kinase family protein, partial [Thermodesulfobacteriota bacterium]|nr:acylglycerol kinase family protein [Thermodesulfobacteriota bacterium]